MLLENDNIKLRALEPEDLDQLYDWENDTELWKIGSSIAPFSRYAIKQYISRFDEDIFQTHQQRFIVELKSTKQSIGTIDLYDFDPFHKRAGVGILVDHKFQCKGFGTQILHLLEEYAFKFLKINQLYAIIPIQNKASIKLFTKCNYQQTGVLKQWLSAEIDFEDAIFMQYINK
ncbi:MAG: GNAT family N-acetyltransferase [Dysgonamonadaceae bacterium]|jgi:diamine N-acetyltransferase|nr:GNAT family N-acetyltransferase [Dysgonamonadaceae bacterium]MDD3308631.1 GNAT family N-acetyltransferase [Dysgonamonadaceae bacterium]MDD3901275.1 GNAT family N-acetyltransferase [Dysgonamonadaceae bacterium]MDD4398262.1 GNAT family N-acetyltransferase [Dysgonamonadaceae bacterium]MEA5080686.1 GNAT family N-acetyltransferase [Dysgonamonadaceae bacterium]